MDIRSPQTQPNIILNYVRFFRFFCIVPYKLVGTANEPKFTINHVSTAITSFILIFFWIGFYFACIQARMNMDIISRTINYFQMILSGIAMTTVFVASMLNIKIFNSIAEKFCTIDQQLRHLGDGQTYYIKETNKFFLFTIISIIFLFTYQIVNYFLYEQRLLQPRWYFIVANTPIIIYSIALIGAILIISFLNTRCHILLEFLKCFNDNENEILNDISTRNLKILKFMNILNSIMQLNSLISKYFGSTLLTTFATLFTITTVQSYYIYWTISNFGVGMGFDGNTLVQSILSNLACFGLLIGITSVCENLTITLKAITNNLSKTISNRNKNIQVCK